MVQLLLMNENYGTAGFLLTKRVFWQVGLVMKKPLQGHL